MAAGGFTFAFVRPIAKLFTSWSDTTPLLDNPSPSGGHSMRTLEGEISLSSPPSSTTKPFRHRHFLGSSYEREQGPSPNRRHKEPPLVAQRLLLLQEMFEGTGRGASAMLSGDPLRTLSSRPPLAKIRPGSPSPMWKIVAVNDSCRFKEKPRSARGFCHTLTSCTAPEIRSHAGSRCG
jgi:hypothetical protein